MRRRRLASQRELASANDDTPIRNAPPDHDPVREQGHDGAEFVRRRAVGDRRVDDDRRTHPLHHDLGASRAATLRLAQLWLDFRQVQVLVARLGDILDAPMERVAQLIMLIVNRISSQWMDASFKMR